MRSVPARGDIGLRSCSRHEGLFFFINISIDIRRETRGKIGVLRWLVDIGRHTCADTEGAL